MKYKSAIKREEGEEKKKRARKKKEAERLDDSGGMGKFENEKN